jgi:hypothetical protein
VAALQTVRGMALVNAATLITELSDLSRFANPRLLMAYLGLVPSEHSSGASVRRGGITKAGSSAARRLLIEAAWCYRFPARVSRDLRLRQEDQTKLIREIAWKGQVRLCAQLSPSRPHRQTRQCRHHRHRPRTGRCLGHRPPDHNTGRLIGEIVWSQQRRHCRKYQSAISGQRRRHDRGQENPRNHYLPDRRSDAGH